MLLCSHEVNSCMYLILVKYCSYIPSSCEIFADFLLEFKYDDAGGYRKTSLGPLCSSLTTNETPNIIIHLASHLQMCYYFLIFNFLIF